MNYWWIIRFPILFASLVRMQIAENSIQHVSSFFCTGYSNAINFFFFPINRSTFWFSWRSWRSFFPNYELTTRVDTLITNFGKLSQCIFIYNKFDLFAFSVTKHKNNVVLFVLLGSPRQPLPSSLCLGFMRLYLSLLQMSRQQVFCATLKSSSPFFSIHFR